MRYLLRPLVLSRSKPTASTSAEVGIPGFGKIQLGGGVSTETTSQSANSSTRNVGGMAAVRREIAGSDFVVFLDDFHYIPRQLQEDIGKQIKSGSDAGIRFIIASVPHRSDDVVRSNHELRGRTINVDTDYWSISDLVKIGLQGFAALHYEVDAAIINDFARESCTSPQIMQALLLQLCFDLDLRISADSMTKVEIPAGVFTKVLEQTSTRTSYTSLVKQMHAGPRTRGTERKEFQFTDGSTGDAYRACLLALKQDPPTMEFNYAELQSRIGDVCINDRPVGSSITESLKQIASFADQMHPNQRIVEWDPDAASGTFAIIDPYFLFFLRASDQVSILGKVS